MRFANCFAPSSDDVHQNSDCSCTAGKIATLPVVLCVLISLLVTEPPRQGQQRLQPCFDVSACDLLAERVYAALVLRSSAITAAS